MSHEYTRKKKRKKNSTSRDATNMSGATLEQSPTHWRCFSHNKYYPHEHVKPILSAAQMHPHCIEIELAFHVLSPLPGLENASENELVNHLNAMVESVNADYSGQPYNFDSARTHHPLFKSTLDQGL